MYKKIISFSILIFIIIQYTLLPIHAEGDEKLASYVRKANTLFRIPKALSDFQFFINNGDSNENQVTLVWQNPSPNAYENISVTFDSLKRVLLYEHEMPVFLDSAEKIKIPKLSQDQAIKKGYSYIRTIAPDIARKVVKSSDAVIQYSQGNYAILYNRTVRGFPVENEGIILQLDASDGKLISFRRIFTDTIFPQVSPEISKETAKQLFSGHVGFDVYYGIQTHNKKNQVFPVYASIQASSFAINASNGNLIQLPNTKPLTPFANYSPVEVEETSSNSFPKNSAITNIQLNASNSPSKGKLLDIQTAENILRQSTFLGLSESYKRDSVSLKKIDQKSFWSFKFTGSSTSPNASILVQCDAESGEVFSFRKFVNPSIVSSYENVLTTKKGKKSAEIFLSTNFSQKFKSSRYLPNISPTSKAAVRNFGSIPVASYVYYRIKNKIPFLGNSLKVEVDLTSGNVLSLEQVWDDTLRFPSPKRFIAKDKIAPKMNRSLTPKLSFINTNPDPSALIPEYQLAYTFNGNQAIYHGLTGKRLTPGNSNSGYVYSDLENHYSEKYVMQLASIGIGLEGTELNPELPITQREFFQLLYQSFGESSTENSTESDKNNEPILKYLEDKGIASKKEYSPDAWVLREEAVKYFVRAMNYEKPAKVTGMFVYPFQDADKANPDLKGYITIAHGLQLIRGDSQNNFSPKSPLTRAEAMVILYNYLWHE